MSCGPSQKLNNGDFYRYKISNLVEHIFQKNFIQRQMYNKYYKSKPVLVKQDLKIQNFEVDLKSLFKNQKTNKNNMSPISDYQCNTLEEQVGMFLLYWYESSLTWINIIIYI